MNGEPTTFVLSGDELVVADLGDGWFVCCGDRSVRARYLDLALAELLGLPPGLVLSLVKQILEGEPGEELSL